MVVERDALGCFKFLLRYHLQFRDIICIKTSSNNGYRYAITQTFINTGNWPAPGSEDTELGVLMELEVGHGETEVHTGIQA